MTDALIRQQKQWHPYECAHTYTQTYTYTYNQARAISIISILYYTYTDAYIVGKVRMQKVRVAPHRLARPQIIAIQPYRTASGGTR